MKKFLNKKIFIFIIIILGISFFEVSNNIGKNRWYKSLLPLNIKESLKETFFTEKNKISKLTILNQQYSQLIKKNEKIIKEKDEQIIKLVKQIGKINFIFKNKNEILSEKNNKKYIMTKYTTPDLVIGKMPIYKPKSSSYIDYYDNNLILASGTGIIAYSNFNNIKEEDFYFNIIPSNILNIIKYKEFFEKTFYGIKDVKIYKNKIFISYSNKVKEDCYNTSILYADFNYKKLDFKKLFSPNECVNLNNDFGLTADWSQGGKIFLKDNDEIFFTVGTFGFETESQKNDNPFGKILSINFETKEYKIISIGHRNPQGLYYDSKSKIIINTEHGPFGGDELNINKLENDIIHNFGWPVSSYGEHVGLTKRDMNHPMYIKAPLHKSHEKYGFNEPIKYWTPSIAVSEIIAVSDNFLKLNTNLPHFFMGTLGSKKNKDSLSLHYFELSNDYKKILDSEVIFIGERIRDMVFLEEKNKIILFLESSASIGILELI